MASEIRRFFGLAASLARLNQPYGRDPESLGDIHPFDARNIHRLVQIVSKQLFDDGHYSQASFEAWKLVEKLVQAISKENTSGSKLMLKVFSPDNPKVKLTELDGTSGQDEQQGFQFLFAGGILSIRNPRAHELISRTDDPDSCLDHLNFASMLLRKLEEIGCPLETLFGRITR